MAGIQLLQLGDMLEDMQLLLVTVSASESSSRASSDVPLL
jgi:hypothetical protein